MTAPNAARLEWPAERLYWSVIDLPAAGRGGPLPGALLEEFAEDVPVPAEGLFAVAAPTACGRTVVCAAGRDELAGVAAHVLSVTPDSIPGVLGVEAEPGALNFMVGEFEPRPLRARRRRWRAMGIGVLVAAGVLVSIGLGRRAAHAAEVGRAARAQADVIAAEMLPGHDPAWAERMLEDELAGLRARAGASALTGAPPDAALRLAGLLRAWPSVPSRPQSLSVTPGAVMASVSLEGDPAEFLRALKPPPGWTLEEPRMNSASGITRVSLRFAPAADIVKGVTP